jgi:hypothetical protein
VTGYTASDAVSWPLGSAAATIDRIAVGSCRVLVPPLSVAEPRGDTMPMLKVLKFKFHLWQVGVPVQHVTDVHELFGLWWGCDQDTLAEVIRMLESYVEQKVQAKVDPAFLLYLAARIYADRFLDGH